MELLGRFFGEPSTSYTALATRATVVSVYLHAKPDWSRARQAELGIALEQIRCRGLEIGRGRITLKAIGREDWAESWKLHFRPLEIGSALLLKPSWSRRRPRKGQVVVVLDPGLSFGTGHHPTTAFCLHQLVAQRRPGQTQSCLDVGTGSGILAIAAAKLGYSPVDAFDFDPEAIRIARANAQRNRVSARTRFRRQDLAQLPRRSSAKYSVVCANLVSRLLLAERDRLVARLRADGVLLVAGVLKEEFAQIRQAFAVAGLRLVASRTGKEWRSGAFRQEHFGFAMPSPWRFANYFE